MSQTIPEVFELQKAHSLTLRNTNSSQRKSKLLKLKSVIESCEKAIYEALYKDLGKPHFEAAITEMFFVYAEIDFAVKNLRKWMKPKRTSAGLTALFSRNRIYYEPKGVSLIIAPWNYPFQLLMSPLISAISAGNCAILKPSEVSSFTSAVVSKMISENFDPGEIACFVGDAEISKELLGLPFDHIFFTGGTNIGKVVMAAAAKNLTAVTLELGGKSPVIIDEHTDLKKTAEKIMWGKFMNAGQTCIAPDYVLIRPDQQDEFLRHSIQALKKHYYQYGKLDKTSYGKIINGKNFDRLTSLIDEAREKGAVVSFGGEINEAERIIEPVIVSNVSADCGLMQEEIFGPVLPLINYRDLDDAISFINQRPKPLALYVFSDKKSVVERVIRQTSAGGTTVNDVMIHIANPRLPFGGVGESGLGSAHGFFGFKAFSHERAVMFQSGVDLNKLAYPPYSEKKGLLKLLKKLM